MTASLIRKGSVAVPAPQADIFSLPGTAIGVRDKRTIEVPLATALTENSPLTFRVYQPRGWISLQDSYLAVKFKVTLADGSNVPDSYSTPEYLPDGKPKMDANNKPVQKKIKKLTIAPIQYIGATLIKAWQIALNGTVVGDQSNVNQAIRAYFESEFLLSKKVRKSQLAASGYRFDSEVGVEGDGFKERAEMVKGSNSCWVYSRIHHDLFNQRRLLPPFVDLQLTGFVNSDAFLLENHTEDDVREFKLVIESAKLVLQEWELIEEYANAIQREIMVRKCINFPVQAVAMRSVFCEEGRTSLDETQLFHMIPQKLFAMFIPAVNYYGNMGTSPFRATPSDVSRISVTAGSKTFPHRPILMDFAKKDAIMPFLNTMEALGFARGPDENGLTPDSWMVSRTVFGFELSPNCHSDLFDLSQRGITSISCEFSKPVPKNGLVLVVIAVYPDCIVLDENRNVMQSGLVV